MFCKIRFVGKVNTSWVNAMEMTASVDVILVTDMSIDDFVSDWNFHGGDIIFVI